ncbi:MAG TPA: hypothetical protein PKI11_13210 [Candidatus Hydrogenedentes bacterium]|nr:hypothetical protein [Candidatus Hydrogenedentota bacterium]HNT88628.1 hypothetical protein [Candidatus Hydrogenedentota bacterium]
MKKHRALSMWAALPLLLLCGCPIGYVIVPFDSSGVYSGTWEATLEGSSEVISCVVTVALEQDVEAGFPEDHLVRGTITLNMTCPGALRELGRLGFPAIVHLSLTGAQLPDGSLYFVSGACEELTCQGVFVSARGQDADDDGRMDVIEGDWSFGALIGSNIITLRGGLTAVASAG